MLQRRLIFCAPLPAEFLVYLTAHLSLVEATEVAKQLMVACGNSDVSYKKPEVQVEQKSVESEGLLGEYNVLEIIGEGSFARIHRARHKKSEEVYALKVGFLQ